MKFIKYYWENKPYRLIIVLALIVRLLAVVFAKGFGMHDDHFLVIEASQSWVDGEDYNNWLPWNQANPKPEGHSFFYVGLHFFFFCGLKLLGITDPQFKMFLVRLIHALFSMVVVVLGYKIVEKLSDKKSAKQAGLLLAILWFMPWMAVRNLVEIACIPFMFIGIWHLLKSEESKNPLRACLIAGLIMGLAFSVRFQTLIFIVGTGFVLLLLKKWKQAIWFGTGALLSIIIIQSAVDMVIWKYPFAELSEYVRYNIKNRYEYFTGNWYNYLLLVMGIIIPPYGIFLFYGFLRTWKKYALIFVPAFLFFVFHSYFPNKQERFIFPVIPFIIMLGVMGWGEFVRKSVYWQHHKNLLKYAMAFFWVINLILLPVVSTSYSKKSRVEAMTYLSRKGELKSLIVEDTNSDSARLMPMFYLNKWVDIYEISGKYSPAKYDFLKKMNPTDLPDYVMFCGELNMDTRIQQVKTLVPGLEYETTIEPGNLDKFMYWLNPVNKNQYIYIYKILKDVN